MAVDTRATTTITIAGTAYTLISATLTDESIQGSGLVRCRGNAVIAGTLTPAVGAIVRFSYTTATGTTRNIPRTLRVLSSFANPQTRETQIELGDKLIYLDNRKPGTSKVNTREENGAYPCSVFESATLPISATYVVQFCLTKLGLTSSTIPLTNRFSDDTYDLSGGYVSAIGELLLSESYVGYLDYSEVLQIRNLGAVGSTGSLLTSADCIALSPIGTGALPGEAVAVSYNAKTFVPTVTPGPNSLWDTEETWGDPLFVYVYETYGDTDQERYFIYADYGFNETLYDVYNRAIKRRVHTPAFPIDIYETTYWTYRKAAPAAGDGTELASDCIYDKTDETNDVASEYTVKSEALSSIIKQCNFDPNYYPLSTSLGGSTRVVTEITKIEYEQSTTGADGRKVTKTKTTKLIPYVFTPGGSEIIRKQAALVQVGPGQIAPTLWTADLVINNAKVLRSYGGNIKIRSERNFGLQQRPGQSDRNAEALSRDRGTTESEVKLEWLYGSAISQDVVEFSLPKSPDDYYTWTLGGGYVLNKSDAQEKAQKYGRVQNAMLLGNRQGMGIQCSPLKLPPNPFDAFYVQIGGFNAQYRANGLQWNINATDVIASCDAMLWGAVGAASGTDLTTSWIPLAPGTTTLPVTPVGTGTAGGTTVASDGTYGTVLTPASVTLPYVETVRSDGVIRLYADEPTTVAMRFDFILSGEYVLTGYAISAITYYTVTITSGIYTLTGNAIDTAESLGELITTGTYTLTGNDIQTVPVFADYTVDIALGTYALTGNAIAVSGSSTIIDVSAITYTQSSVWVDNTAATNATMTNGVTAEATSTGTDFDGPSFVTMDLGAILPVATIYVGSDFANTLGGGWGPSYTADADLEYSTDGSSWTIITSPIGAFTSGLKGFSVDFFARYIRIVAYDYIALTEFYATSTEDSAVGSSDIINSGTYALTGNDIGATQNFTVTITNGTYTLTGNNIETSDAYFSSVALLLHMEGTNGSPTFVDSSNNNYTPTVYGNTQISTVEKRFGDSSALFDGTGDYLYWGAGSANLGSGDASIEGWFRFNSLAGDIGIFVIHPGEASTIPAAEFTHFGLKYNGGLFARVTGVSYFLGTTLSTGTDYHIAAIRHAGGWKVYINGTVLNTSSLADTSNYSSTWGLSLGAYNTSGMQYMNGYIDEFRVTPGLARYTANFTAPTAPFPDS